MHGSMNVKKTIYLFTHKYKKTQCLCIVYLGMVSASHNTWRQMTRHLVNDDLEGMCKEVASPKSGLLPSHLIGID